MSDIKLTPHFGLLEMTSSSFFPEYNGINMSYALTHNYVLLNATRLCQVLEFLRLKYGKPIRVNSGIRCIPLNTAVGGVPTSNHIHGLAVDIPYTPELIQICRSLKKHGFLDELIVNDKKGYIHLSVPDLT